MDTNYIIPSFLSILGLGLVIVASVADTRPNRNYIVKNEKQSKPGQARYHYSRTVIKKLTFQKPPGRNSPKGFWFAFSKTDWFNRAKDDGIYRPGGKLYLYSISFSSPPKLYSVKDVSQAQKLCDTIYTHDIVDTDGITEAVNWNVLRDDGYDGVEVLPGVINAIEAKLKTHKNDKIRCLNILQQFNVDSGCLWNVDKVVLKEEGTVIV